MSSKSSVRKLFLTHDNPCNTTITDSETGQTVYEVYTEHGKDTITFMKNATGEVIASWLWHEGRSDEITLGNAKPIPLSAWLKKSLIPFNLTMFMRGEDGKEYRWKGYEPGRSLEVFVAGDHDNAIARFDRSRRTREQTVIPAKMLLDWRGQEMEELIVIGFMALEKKRRASEVSIVNRADALAIPPFTLAPSRSS